MNLYLLGMNTVIFLFAYFETESCYIAHTGLKLRSSCIILQRADYRLAPSCQTIMWYLGKQRDVIWDFLQHDKNGQEWCLLLHLWGAETGSVMRRGSFCYCLLLHTLSFLRRKKKALNLSALFLNIRNCVWWWTPIVLEAKAEGAPQLKACLGYVATPCLRKQNTLNKTPTPQPKLNNSS